MKKIPLTQGKFAKVDDEDYEWLSKWKWYCNSDGYAVRSQWDFVTKKSTAIRMHRLIMGAKKGEIVDHINRNKLDNRRCNIRITTQVYNMQNVKSRAGSASNYKGVWRHKREEKWYSRITHNKILINLGSYANEKDAARAYDKKVIELFGEHAYLNLPRRIPRK